jgi:large subunit ribosomal protein L21
LSAAKGESVELDKVLLVAVDDKVNIGKPTVEGAKVVATVADEGRADKVVIFKYKAKTRYRRKRGHRQPFTSLSIDKIVAPGIIEAEPVKKARTRRKKEVAAEPKAETEAAKEVEVKENGA